MRIAASELHNNVELASSSSSSSCGAASQNSVVTHEVNDFYDGQNAAADQQPKVSAYVT